MSSAKWRPFCPGLNVLSNATLANDSAMWQVHALLLAMALCHGRYITIYTSFIISKLILWMKIVVFCLVQVLPIFFVRVELKIVSVGSENGSAPNRREAIIKKDHGLDQWALHAF